MSDTTKGEEILASLPIHIHVDGPTHAEWLSMAEAPYVKGATFNPSLCRKLGVTDYEKFCKDVIAAAQGKLVSLEVLSDDWSEMRRQAIRLASWGENVLVKIPVTNTKGEPSGDLVRELEADGVAVNLTAITSCAMFRNVMARCEPTVISVFVGRMTDAGFKPKASVGECAKILRLNGQRCTRLLWASTREVWNILQAEEAGADIITVPVPILCKAVQKFGCDLEKESLDLVKLFHSDAVAAGFTL